MHDGSDIEWFDRLGGEPAEVVAHDVRWSRDAAGWRRRIAAAIDLPVVRVEHIGSTAVPGLVAKPVLDLQVAVPVLDDEGVYRPALESLGLVLRARAHDHRFFRPPAGAPRTVHVHVCALGSAWEDDHLRFRDALRADPAAIRAYAALKQHLAAKVGHDRGAYTAGKAAFIRAVLDRA